MEGQHPGQYNPAPVQFAWTGQEPIPAQQQQQSPYPQHPQQQQEQPPHGHPHKHNDVTFSTWDYLEHLSDPSLLPQHLPHPHLRVDISHPPAQSAGHLLTPSSTHTSSPRSASTTASAMPFSIRGVPALSPGGSPSTSSSMEPLPPRLPALPVLGAPTTGATYNPYPYQNQPYGGTMTTLYGAPTPAFDNTMFIKQTLPCGRQRIEQACEKCRERKARCNGGRPTCARCLQRGYECVYAPERRMRGPNKVKKQSSRGIQPRSSTTSLSSSFNSRDGKSPSSTNTGTPSPTEENFGQLLMDDASGPRNVASTGNLGARITRPADISHPSLSPLATISPGMARSSSGAVLHERSLSNGSTRSAAKPRLSVEAPPVTDASGTGTPVFPSSGKRAPAPGTLGLSVRPELGLGMPTFPNPPTLPGQAPWSGYIPPTAYMASAQQQAAYLPGIPGIPHVPSDFTPTTEGVQYLAYPYGMGAYPGAGMQFPHGPNAAGEGSDAQHVLAAKGYGAGQEYGAHGGYDRGAVKPQPLSPAQLAYMSALVDDRGHSRTPSSGASALSASPGDALPPLPGSALPTFPGSALTGDSRLGTGSSGSTTATSSSDGPYPNPGALLSPTGAQLAHGRALSLTALADMQQYGYAPITPPDSGDSSAAAAVPDVGISPQRTMGTAMAQFGY